MTSVDEEREFRYWTFQLVGGAFFSAVCASFTLVVLFAAITQANFLGYLMTLVGVVFTCYWAWLQFFLWRTQAWSIRASNSGLAGKPLFGAPVELLWEDLAEIGVTRTGFLIPPQIEIRDRSKKFIRVAYLLPQLTALIETIRKRAPHCHSSLPPMPAVAIPDLWKK